MFNVSVFPTQVLRRRYSNCSDLDKNRPFLSQFSGGSIDLTIDGRAGIATITVNHPERKNAFTGKMMVELADTVEELKGWRSGKAVIVCGAGNTFCSGGDLNLMKEIVNEPGAGNLMCEFMQHTLTSLFRLKLLSVAVIEGRALGGGAEVATACDFRLATPESRIGFVQSQMGLTTGWGGGSRLVHILGRTGALKLLTSAQILHAEQALKCGFIDEVIPSDDALDEAVIWLKKLTHGEPEIIQGFKSTIATATEKNLNESLKFERQIFASVFGGEAQQKALNRGAKHK